MRIPVYARTLVRGCCLLKLFEAFLRIYEMFEAFLKPFEAFFEAF
jgi:hypothetical protein